MVLATDALGLYVFFFSDVLALYFFFFGFFVEMETAFSGFGCGLGMDISGLGTGTSFFGRGGGGGGGGFLIFSLAAGGEALAAFGWFAGPGSDTMRTAIADGGVKRLVGLRFGTMTSARIKAK